MFHACFIAFNIYIFNLLTQYNKIQYNTIQYNTIQYNTIQYNTIQYNTIQYKHEYYYSGINPVELRGHTTPFLFHLETAGFALFQPRFFHFTIQSFNVGKIMGNVLFLSSMLIPLHVRHFRLHLLCNRSCT